MSTLGTTTGMKKTTVNAMALIAPGDLPVSGDFHCLAGGRPNLLNGIQYAMGTRDCPALE
jgi:hypothetical protein